MCLFEGAGGGSERNIIEGKENGVCLRVPVKHPCA